MKKLTNSIFETAQKLEKEKFKEVSSLFNPTEWDSIIVNNSNKTYFFSK